MSAGGVSVLQELLLCYLQHLVKVNVYKSQWTNCSPQLSGPALESFTFASKVFKSQTEVWVQSGLTGGAVERGQ